MSRFSLPILLVLVSFVWAQDQSNFLDRYNRAISDLNSSIVTLGTASEQSLADLNNAESRLRPLSENSTSTSLVAGMTNTFERARDMVVAQSEVDLRAQVAVLRGGFERLLYEQALSELRQGNVGQAQQSFTQLAVDMGLSADYSSALAAAPNAAAAQQVFEQAVAENIQRRIASAQAISNAESPSQEDRNAAYLALAEAYGQLIPIQDSPRVSENLNSDLINAVNALVSSRQEDLNNQLSVVDSEVTQVVASGAPAVNTPTVVIPTVPTPTPTAPPVTAPVTTPPVSAPPVTSTPEVSTPSATTTPSVPESATVADIPSTTTLAITTTTDTSSAVGTPVTVPAATTAAVAGVNMQSFMDQQTEAAMTSLRAGFQGFNLGSGRSEQLARLYYERGYDDIDDAITGMFAVSAQALVAVEVGNQAGAHGHIQAFRRTYDELFQPIIQVRDPGFNQSTVNLINSLEAAPALRLQDAAVLVGHVDAIKAVINNNSPTLVHNTIVTTTTYWIGWVRLVAMIVLAILAFFPIRLLFLAFGGGNRNWQWVGFALFLLLLPIIWEGLSFVGSIIANLTGIPAFNSLSSFSLFQNTISQILWVFITGIAIIFATMGLYGICVQFGLIGRRNKPVAATATTTDTQTSLTESEVGTDTVVDWDEEF